MATHSGWSLRSEDWETVKLLLGNVHWYQIKLDLTYAISVPRKAGVYLLAAGADPFVSELASADIFSSILYVGRADDLRRRFSQHTRRRHSNPMIAECHKTFLNMRFYFALVPDDRRTTASEHLSPEHWIKSAERALIVALGPPANRSVPTASSIPGRLLPPHRIGSSW